MPTPQKAESDWLSYVVLSLIFQKKITSELLDAVTRRLLTKRHAIAPCHSQCAYTHPAEPWRHGCKEGRWHF